MKKLFLVLVLFVFLVPTTNGQQMGGKKSKLSLSSGLVLSVPGLDNHQNWKQGLQIRGQAKNKSSPSPWPHLILSIIYPLTSSISEYYLFKKYYVDKDPNERETSDIRWHQWTWAERLSGISLGIAIGFHSEFDLWKLIKDLFLSGAIFWNTYDLSLNIQRGLPVFRDSDVTGSRFEQFNFLKIPVLVAAVGVYLFWD